MADRGDGTEGGEAATPPREGIPRGARVFLVLLLGAAIGAALYFGDIRALSPDRLRDWVDGFGVWGPVIYLGLFVVGAVVVAPGTLLAAVGALLFPLPVAILLVWLGAVLGAHVCFFLARHLGRDFVEHRLGHHIARIDRAIETRGFQIILMMRMTGMPPGNVLNYAAGLTRLRLRDYALGTAVGIVPPLVVFVTLVNRLGTTPSLGQVLHDPLLWAAVAGIVVVVAGARVLRRRTRGLVQVEDDDGTTSLAPGDLR